MKKFFSFRVFIGSVLFIGVFFFPYWISAVIALIGLIVIPYYWEAIVVLGLVELLYKGGVSVELFTVVPLLILAFFVMVQISREYFREYFLRY